MRARSAGLLGARFASPGVARALATSAAARQAIAADPPSANDKFLSGNNAYYVEEMYRQWKDDPESVHASWQAYFSGLAKGIPSQDAVVLPPALSDGALIQAPLTSTQVQGVDVALKVCAPPCPQGSH